MWKPLLVMLLTIAVTKALNCSSFADSTINSCKCSTSRRILHCKGLKLYVNDAEHMIEIECKDNSSDLSVIKNINLSANYNDQGLSIHACSMINVSVFDLLQNINVKSITRLKISSNHLLHMAVDKNLFGTVSKYLTHLSLNNLGLRQLPVDMFEGMTNLTSLDLSENLLTELPQNMFDGDYLLNLRTLSLHHNRMTTFPVALLAENSKVNINNLDVSFNKITGITKSSKRSRLCGNDIDENKSLKTLNISNNHGIRLDRGVLTECHFLEELQVVNVGLKQINNDWKNLPRLQTLNVSSNRIKFMEGSSVKFDRTTESQFPIAIDLSKNDIEEVDFSQVDNSSRAIRLLDLSQNRLKVLPKELLNLIKQGTIQQVGLKENEWVCSMCKSIQLIDFSKHYIKQIKDSSELTCADGTLLADVDTSLLCEVHSKAVVYMLCATTTIIIVPVVMFFFYRNHRQSRTTDI